MGNFITAVKSCCTEVYAPMASANAQKVLHSMGGPCGLALQWQTDEVERSLEMCMPEEELPKVEEMV